MGTVWVDMHAHVMEESHSREQKHKQRSASVACFLPMHTCVALSGFVGAKGLPNRLATGARSAGCLRADIHRALDRLHSDIFAVFGAMALEHEG